MNTKKLSEHLDVIPLNVSGVRDVREDLERQCEAILKTAKDAKRDLSENEAKTFDELVRLKRGIDAGVIGNLLGSGDSDGGGILTPGRVNTGPAREYKHIFGESMRDFVRGDRAAVEERGLTTTNSSGILQNPLIMNEYVANLSALSPFARMGVRYVVDQSNYQAYPAASGEPVVSYLSEVGTITEDTSWAVKQNKATFQTAVLLIKSSRQLLMDSPDTAQFVQQEMNIAFNNFLSQQIMQGSGSGQATGLDNVSGINTVDLAGSAYDFDDYINWSKTLVSNRVRPEMIGFLHGASSWAYAAKLKDSQNRYLDKPELLRSQTWEVTSAVKEDYASTRTKIYAGDFSTVSAVFRQAVGREQPGYGGFQVLDQLYAENFQTGFLAWVNFDFVYHRPTSLIRIDGVPLS